MLQNTNTSTVAKHYRHKGVEYYTNLAEVREAQHKKLIS